MSAASLLLEFEDALRRGDPTNLENVFVRAAELPQRVTGRTAAGARSAFDLDAGREALDGGWPPLLYAAKEGHAALVSLLLARGANIEARAFCDADALTLAAGIGSTETVEVLLREGAHVQGGWLSDRGTTRSPLVEACRSAHVEVAMVLLGIMKWYVVRAKTSRAKTRAAELGAEASEALRCAAAAGHEAMVALLLRAHVAVPPGCASGAFLNRHYGVGGLLLALDTSMPKWLVDAEQPGVFTSIIALLSPRDGTVEFKDVLRETRRLTFIERLRGASEHLKDLVRLRRGKRGRRRGRRKGRRGRGKMHVL